MNVMRTKEEIIEDIRNLVKAKGYIYALCMILLEERIIELETMHKIDHNSRLGVKEVSFLLGFAIQNKADISIPDKKELFGLTKRTRELMRELQGYFGGKFISLITTFPGKPKSATEIFSDSDMIVEPIFYSGTGAYDIQYLGFLKEKYKYDEDWLRLNKNFDIDKTKRIVSEIKRIVERKQCLAARDLSRVKEYVLSTNATGKEWIPFCKGLIEFFVIRESNFSGDLGIDIFLENFSLVPGANVNSQFQGIGEFNLFNERPIIKLDEERYFVPIAFSVFAAVYENPFYWFSKDKPYRQRAKDNRGTVGEEITYELLLKVFGKDKTFQSVGVKKQNGKDDVTDIDVLCILGSKALCVQVKSKKLTKRAETGDIKKLKEDFEGCVQNAYCQGLRSRKAILNREGKFRFYRKNGVEMTLPKGIDEVYIMVVTTEVFPNLDYLLGIMLNKKGDQQDPMLSTIFDLELTTHYLNDPYDFLYYVRQRVLVSRFHIGEDIDFLAYHLMEKLKGLPKGTFPVRLGGYGQLIDRNYYPLKTGLPDSGKGDEMKNRWKNEEFDRLCDKLKSLNRLETTDMIFHMLDMNYEYRDEFIDRIIETKQRTLGDGKYHCFSIMPLGLGDGFSKFGIIYFSEGSNDSSELRRRLSDLCQAAKYRSKSDVWIGFGSLKNSDEIFDEVVFYSQKWKPNPNLEKLSNTVLITPARETLDGLP